MEKPKLVKTIVEIAVEATANQIKGIEVFLKMRQIPYYIEPPNRYYSLEDLEADCEGK